MAKWSRRSVFKMAMAAGPLVAGRAAIPVGLFALAAPQPAKAWVVAALTVCSAVSNAVAASNQGDGGLSGSLQFTIAMLRSMAGQLDNLQASIQKVLEAVSRLPDEQRRLMNEARLQTLRDALGGAARQYSEEMKRASQFELHGGYKAWREHPLTEGKLTSIDIELSRIRGILMSGGDLDPITMIYLAATTRVALAVRVALGEPDYALRSTGDDYLALFEAARDESNPKSIVGLRNACQAAATERIESLAKLSCRLPYSVQEDEVSRTLILEAVLVQERRTRLADGLSIVFDAVVATHQAYFIATTSSKLEQLAGSTAQRPWFVRQYYLSPDVKAVMKESAPDLAIDREVAPLPSEAEYMKRVKDETPDLPFGRTVLVPPPLPPQRTHDVPVSPPEQLPEHAKNASEYKVALERHAKIDAHLNDEEGLNVQLANITLCALALETIERASADIFGYFAEPT